MISSTTATGGILIFGHGLGLLDLKEVRVANMLPAVLFAPARHSEYAVAALPYEDAVDTLILAGGTKCKDRADVHSVGRNG